MKAEHQTCLAHLLRRCDEIREPAHGRAREIPRAVKAILHDALEVRRHRDGGEWNEQRVDRELARLDALLDRPASRGRTTGVCWVTCAPSGTRCSRSSGIPAWTPPTGGRSTRSGRRLSTARSGRQPDTAGCPDPGGADLADADLQAARGERPRLPGRNPATPSRRSSHPRADPRWLSAGVVHLLSPAMRIADDGAMATTRHVHRGRQAGGRRPA